MVIAKCVECGKEYELGEDENPADFQCECGGDLEHAIATQPTSDKTPKSSESSKGILEIWNQQPTTIKAISIIGVFLVLVVLIIGITGMFSTTQNTTQSPATSTSNNTSTSPETPQVQAGTVTLINPQVLGYNNRYNLYGELIPSENFDYLAIVVKSYAADNKVVGREQVWNMSSAKKGEKYELSGAIITSGVTTQADILVFNSPNTNDDSKAIHKITVYVK